MADWLIDSNVLLVVSNSDSDDRNSAWGSLAALGESDAVLWLSPQNLIEFWAVATRPRTSNGLEWETTRAADAIRGFLEHFRLAADDARVFDVWMDLVRRHEVRGRQVFDARLAAVMVRHSIPNLLTFNDKDFKRFPSIRARNPRRWAETLPLDD